MSTATIAKGEQAHRDKKLAAFDTLNPGADAVAVMRDIRAEFRDFGQFILETTPISREQSLAFTKLEEAMMWANKAVATFSAGVRQV